VFPTRGPGEYRRPSPHWIGCSTTPAPSQPNVTDAAFALDVMAGQDPLDPCETKDPTLSADRPLHAYLKTDALKGKRFGRARPSFSEGAGIPFQGIPGSEPAKMFEADRVAARIPLRPETRAAFMKGNRGAAPPPGQLWSSTIPSPPTASQKRPSRICTFPTSARVRKKFLAEYGPLQYRSIGDYQESSDPRYRMKSSDSEADDNGRPHNPAVTLETGSQADANFLGPDRRKNPRKAYTGNPRPSASGTDLSYPATADAAARRNHAPGPVNQRRPRTADYQLGKH